jgi:hypothetical protein
VEDGTAQRDKPLFQVLLSFFFLAFAPVCLPTIWLLANAPVPAVQILQENKDKKDAEFNERFKHSKLPNHLTSYLTAPAKHR